MWIRHAALPPGLVLLSLLGACSQTRPQVTSHRSIPTQYVQGSFVIQTAGERSDQDVQKPATDAGQALGCQANAPTRINWSAESGVLSDAMTNSFNVTFSGCDFSDKGTLAILDKLAGVSGIRAARAEAIA